VGRDIPHLCRLDLRPTQPPIQWVPGVDRADQYFSYYSVLRKTEMVEKSGTLSAKLCSCQRIFCVQDTKYKQKVKYKNLLQEVGR